MLPKLCVFNWAVLYHLTASIIHLLDYSFSEHRPDNRDQDEGSACLLQPSELSRAYALGVNLAESTYALHGAEAG